MKPSLYLPAFFFFFISLLVISCQNNEQQTEALDIISDSASITGLTGDSVKLVKTASIHFKVKDVEQGTRAVSSLAQKLGGMIFHRRVEAAEGGRNELKISADSLLVITNYTPRAEVTARVPSHNLEAFLYGVADLGYFTESSNLDIDDKSMVYLRNVLKQKARSEVLNRPAVQKGSSSVNLKTIDVQDEAIEQQIANRSIDADVQYSAVNLRLFQNPLVRKEVIANYVLSDYQLPFGQRISHALRDGWQAFLAFVLVLAHLWVFILLGVGGLIAYRYWMQKRRLAGARQ